MTATSLTASVVSACFMLLAQTGVSAAAESEEWLDQAFSKSSIVSSGRPSARHRAVRVAAVPVSDEDWEDDEDRPRQARRGRGARTKAASRAVAEPRQAARRNARRTRVASLGRFEAPAPARQRSLSGGSVNWTASSGCLASPLRSVIAQIAANFGAVRVNSTCRSRRHNARVGGARHSHHLHGGAADFRVFGSVSAVYAFLRGSGLVGGLKHYGHGLFHIDNGPRRTW